MPGLPPVPRLEWLCTDSHRCTSETQRLTAVAIVARHCIVTCNSEGVVRFFVLWQPADNRPPRCVCMSEQKLCDQPILSCDHAHVAWPPGAGSCQDASAGGRHTIL